MMKFCGGHEIQSGRLEAVGGGILGIRIVIGIVFFFLGGLK